MSNSNTENSSNLPDSSEAKQMASDAIHNAKQSAEDVQQNMKNEGVVSNAAHNAKQSAEDAQREADKKQETVTDSVKGAISSGADFVSKKAEEIKQSFSK